MSDIDLLQTITLGVVAGVFAAGGVTFYFLHHLPETRWQRLHEENASEREKRAIERHDKEMLALQHAARMTQGAIALGGRLEKRVEALEQWKQEHEEHHKQ